MVVLLVALGGALGAWLRYRTIAAVQAMTGAAFPWGTLAVNVTGSFAVGLLLPLLVHSPAGAPLRAFLTVGCAGAFTTYSTFAHDAVVMIHHGHRARAAAYAAMSVTFGVGAVAAGLFIGSAVAA